MQSIKAVVVGEAYSGKSSLLISYTSNVFTPEYVATVFDTYAVNLMVDNKTLQLCLYDVSGHEDYDRLRPLCYAHVNVFLIVFSLVQPASFAKIRNKWLPEIRFYRPTTPWLLVGTKLDLRKKASHSISTEQGLELARELQAVNYVECSSFTLENINLVFEQTVRTSLEKKSFSKSSCCLFL